jgi:UDP-glucose 4-epimerase
VKAVVTGAAGFIGSHLCERLLADGHQVTGLDSFTDYYDRGLKEQNLETSRQHGNFAFEELDLVEDEFGHALADANVVFHLADQSAVRSSWGSHFDRFVRENIVATQRLLETVKQLPVRRVVYASSSAVYGDAEMSPTRETALPRPISPYGMTKLAAEHLALLYMRNFGIPLVALRYFTVYGPRQRPDMALARFIRALATGEEIEVFGDGEQARDFTYISDAVDGTIKAATANVAGQVINLGGGSRVTINQVLTALEEISGMIARKRHLPAAPGDPKHAVASINLARERLGWEPRVSLREGLAQQWGWFQENQNRAGVRFGGLPTLEG